MILTNGLSEGHWKEAVKSAVSIALGVITGEVAIGDLTKGHILHTLSVVGFAIFTAEARYWQKRLRSKEENGKDNVT